MAEDFHDFRPPRTPLVPAGGVDLLARDMTATFAADVTLRSAQERLRGLNQWLPVDGDPDTPLGRLVEENSTGPLRLGYGAWRDLLLGVQFANGRGELISAGGRTVKNVAGYDLTKFMVGGRGVFGRLVTLTTRTYRLPDAALVAQFTPDLTILSRLLPTPLRPHWAVLVPEALWCGYVGDFASIGYYRAALAAVQPWDVENRSVEKDIEHRRGLWQAQGAATFRASVPPLRILEFVKAAGAAGWAADAAFGIVLGPVASDAQPQSIRDAAVGVGGTVVFTTGRDGASHAAESFELSTSPAERRIIERLKHAFDPDTRLTPLPWQPR